MGRMCSVCPHSRTVCIFSTLRPLVSSWLLCSLGISPNRGLKGARWVYLALVIARACAGDSSRCTVDSSKKSRMKLKRAWSKKMLRYARDANRIVENRGLTK